LDDDCAGGCGVVDSDLLLPACLTRLPAARSLSFEAWFQKQNKEIPFVALLLSALQDKLVGWHSCDNLLLL
jgi:hypothetical protein